MVSRFVLNEDLLELFAEATGDRSSIHMDAGFARRTRFRGRIVHGMLPVACMLVSYCAKDATRSRSLRHISCKFLSPLKIGDELSFAFTSSIDGSRDTVEFRILSGDPEVEVTRGKAIFDLSAIAKEGLVAGSASVRSVLLDVVQEARWRLGDLQVGHVEQIEFDSEPDAIGKLVSELLSAVGNDYGDGEGGRTPRIENMSATLVLSTLVGMRLPGRFGTFLECHADFEEDISGCSTLVGSVCKLSPSGRVGLDILWCQGGATKGRGTAMVLVAEPMEEEKVSCAEICSHGELGLKGRVAVVTGASRGIGAATAKLLAMQGARVAVHYFQGRDDAEGVVEDIRQSSGTAISIGADLRNAEQVRALFKRVSDEWGRVDILVNNAVGDFLPKPVELLSSREILGELEVTLFGAHACCQTVLPTMRRQKWGKIINMGSVATEVPVASQAKYVAAKSALVGYTRSLATELVGDNIQVNMVVPAMTKTSLISALPRSIVDRVAEESPGGTLLFPLDVAKVIAFLASEWSSSITGQQIVLNQGMPPFL